MSYPFFVLLLGVHPVLLIAMSNPGQVRQEALLLSVGVAAVGSIALLGSLRLVAGSWPRASVGAALVLILFYAYGPIHGSLEFAMLEWISSTTRIAVPSAVLAYLHPGLTLLAACAAAAGLIAVRRAPAPTITALVRALNVFALVLTGLAALQWRPGVGGSIGETASSGAAVGGARRTSVLGYNPDIYVIVMDGYARADVLAAHYGFDNNPFIERLRSLGFLIGTRSTSNYHWTSLSLSSALNMDYLEPLFGSAVDRGTRDRQVVHEGIRNNALMRFLSARGYRTYHLQSTWSATLENSHADVEIPCQSGAFSDDFIRTVADASWLKVLQSRMSVDLAACHLANFSTLRVLGNEPGPKFVFAHFLPPHHPYLFDRKGRILRQATLSDQFEFQRQLWEDRPAYIEQLRFVNDRILEAVEAIQAESASPPVIVLMSDHGPNIHRGLSQADVMRVRFANFTALLLPGEREHFQPSSSLVNLYRRLLNLYFDAGLQLLPDRYYSSPYERPFNLEEVILKSADS